MQISKVLSEVYGSSSATNSQESIPLQQKLIVCTLLLMVKQGKLKEVTMGKVSVLKYLSLFKLLKCSLNNRQHFSQKFK